MRVGVLGIIVHDFVGWNAGDLTGLQFRSSIRKLERLQRLSSNRHYQRFESVCFFLGIPNRQDCLLRSRGLSRTDSLIKLSKTGKVLIVV